MKIRETGATGESRQAVNASLNKIDGNSVNVETALRLIANKLDTRNTVDHTFATTNQEAVAHNLGRIPKGFIIINQNKAATILGDESLWTAKRIYLTSSVADNAVRMLLL